MEIKLRTLTPLWTGDEERNSARVKESGIVGSLRFWFEGILRGRGLDACNPASGRSDEKCPRMEDKKEKRCLACEVFGATNWARRFRIEVFGLTPTPLFFLTLNGSAATNGKWLRDTFMGKGEYGPLRRSALWSRDGFPLRVTPRAGCGLPVENLVALAIHTSARRGGLGAKTQNGFGQVDVVGQECAERAEQAVEWLKTVRWERSGRNMDGLFRVDDAHFFSLEWRDIAAPAKNDYRVVGEIPGDFHREYFPLAFDLRYKAAREATEEAYGLRVELGAHADELLGTTDHGSRIHVSHLYRRPGEETCRLKIWGDVQGGARSATLDEAMNAAKRLVARRFPEAKEA